MLEATFGKTVVVCEVALGSTADEPVVFIVQRYGREDGSCDMLNVNMVP